MDGFHPSLFMHLCDEGLEIMAQIMELIERLGIMPEGLRWLEVVMLSKPQGGFRPIGLFTSFYRVWGRCRRAQCRQWEATHQHEVNAYTRGHSAISAVWLITLQAELGQREQETSIAVLWDMKQYYEHLDRDRLRHECHEQERFSPVPGGGGAGSLSKRAHHHDANPCQACGQVNDRRGSRVPHHHHHSYPSLHLEAHSCLCGERGGGTPQVILRIFVDDFTTNTRAARQQAIQHMCDATEDLQCWVEDDMQCTIAADKAEVVCSDNDTQN